MDAFLSCAAITKKKEFILGLILAAADDSTTNGLCSLYSL